MDVEDVIAHAVYDPVARRERYLKARKLKGRQKANAHFGPGSRTVDALIPQASSHHGIKANLDARARQKASEARQQAQVAQIRGRLSDLKAHLQELLAKKKADSTKSSSSSDSSKKTTDTKKGPDKPKTAKQKQAAKEALKKAQETRAKEQKKAPDKKTGGTSLTLDEQITHTRAVITDVETKLRAAIDSARTQTAQNGR